MVPNLKPSEPLSQVWFVHDYLQLIFQGERFTIYNVSDLIRPGLEVAHGEPGFCDAVVSLIDQRVIQVDHSDAHVLILTFEQGAQFRVRGDDASVNGPEAYEFQGENQPLVVEQN